MRDPPPCRADAVARPAGRRGFLYWNGPQLYGAKWRNFKMVLVEQEYLTDPALPRNFPRIVNLMTDPKEREPYNVPHLHTWTPPLDYVPHRTE